MFYVHVLGSYDNTFVGPFASAKEAQAFKATVPAQFDGWFLLKRSLTPTSLRFGNGEVEVP